MKKLLLLFFLLLVESSYTQIVNGRLSTSFYSFEKFDTIGISNTYWRGFQTFQFDVTKDKISFNTLIQGNTNLSGDVNEVSNFKIYNLYFRVRKILDIADLNIGRQYVFGGIANGLIDGAYLKFGFLENKLILKTFAGGLVQKDFKPEFNKNLKNNYLVGFHIIGNPIQNLNLSLSYLNRHKERSHYSADRPDTLGLLFNQIISYPSASEQYISGDFDYSYLNYGRVYARYDYDLNLDQSSRIEIGSKINVLNQISLSAEYIKRTPRIYFNSIFYVFQSYNNEEIEGGIEYSYKPNLKLIAKLANIQYSGDKANRYTLGISTEYGSLFYSGSNGYSGELSSVSAQLFYPLLDKKIVPTIAVSRASYKLTKDSDRNESFTGVFGLAFNMFKFVSLDMQVHWLSNKIYKDDFRFFFKANYFFSKKLNIL